MNILSRITITLAVLLFFPQGAFSQPPQPTGTVYATSPTNLFVNLSGTVYPIQVGGGVGLTFTNGITNSAGIVYPYQLPLSAISLAGAGPNYAPIINGGGLAFGQVISFVDAIPNRGLFVDTGDGHAEISIDTTSYSGSGTNFVGYDGSTVRLMPYSSGGGGSSSPKRLLTFGTTNYSALAGSTNVYTNNFYTNNFTDYTNQFGSQWTNNVFTPTQAGLYNVQYANTVYTDSSGPLAAWDIFIIKNTNVIAGCASPGTGENPSVFYNGPCYVYTAQANSLVYLNGTGDKLTFTNNIKLNGVDIGGFISSAFHTLTITTYP